MLLWVSQQGYENMANDKVIIIPFRDEVLNKIPKLCYKLYQAEQSLNHSKALKLFGMILALQWTQGVKQITLDEAIAIGKGEPRSLEKDGTKESN